MNKTILKKSIIESIFGKYTLYLFQFITIIILARLFSPEELGYFAIIQVLIAFSILICDSGLGPAIISDKNVSTESIESSHTVTLLIGIIIGLIVYLISPVLNNFYNSQYYSRDLIWISISILCQALCIVPNALLLKSKKFILIAKCNCAAEILSLLGVLILYNFTKSVEILSIKFFIFSFTKVLLITNALRKTTYIKIRFSSDFKSSKKYFSYALYQFGFNIINFFTRNLDNILIGKYFGLSYLGIYDRAYQLMRYPLQLVTFALVPAIQPSIVDVSSNNTRIYLHNWLAKNLLYIGVSISIIVYTLSDIIVMILFGSKWIEVSSFLKIFSLMIPVQILMSSSGGFFQAFNKVKILFITGSISAFTNIIAISTGIALGDPKYVAIALVISFNFNFLNTYYFLFKYVFKEGIKSFVYSIYKPMIIFLFFIAFSYFIKIQSFIYMFITIIAFLSLLLTMYVYERKSDDLL